MLAQCRLINSWISGCVLPSFAPPPSPTHPPRARLVYACGLSAQSTRCIECILARACVHLEQLLYGLRSDFGAPALHWSVTIIVLPCVRAVVEDNNGQLLHTHNLVYAIAVWSRHGLACAHALSTCRY